jgi:hypothetical protein
VVSPRPTSFISGLTSCDTLTCVKPSVARQRGRRLLVRRVAVAVHEDDGHAAQAGVEGGPQPLAQVHLVERLAHAAVGAHALLRLDDAAVQQLGQHDVAVEQARPLLIGRCAARRGSPW